MSKAASACSKITRRTAIAAVAAFGAPARAASSPLTPDPVFAAIAAHKAAYTRLDQACRYVSRLEGAIPKERRKEWFDEDREQGIGANDDPLWTAALVAQRAAFDAEAQAAWAVARAHPAGLAGAAALLRHAYDSQARGCDWPDELDDNDESWEATFHRNLAAALEAMG